jgi:hypothetical protein
MAAVPATFSYVDTLQNDIIYDHDYIVNIPGLCTITYCVQMQHQGYKLGECIGIKSLAPGQKITQETGVSYSKVVYDETGKQLAIADTTSSESELLGNVSNTLHNLSQASETTTTSWNAGGGVSVDFGICSIGGGGGGSSQDIASSFHEVMSNIITTSATKVKNNKTISALSTFNSLRTTTETQSNTSATVDVIENKSTTRIARFYFHTMYKRYTCTQFIKNISINRFLSNITSMRPLFNRTLLPHAINQSAELETIRRLNGTGITVNSENLTNILGPSGLIGEGGLTASKAGSINGLNSSGLNSSGLNSNSSGMNSSGLNSSGLNSSGLNSSGMNSSGLNSSGLNSSGMNSSGLTSTKSGNTNVETLNAQESNIVNNFTTKSVSTPYIDKIVLIKLVCDFTTFPSTLYITNTNIVSESLPTITNVKCDWNGTTYNITPTPSSVSETSRLRNLLANYLLTNVITKPKSDLYLPIDGFYMRGENGQTLDNR